MSLPPWERGYEPSSVEYVKSYIQFYAKRIGENMEQKISEDGTDNISMQAKTHLVEDLYKNLDTLDSKASALLTFCGVVLASITVMISLSYDTKYDFVLYFLFTSVTISSILALTVINVHWTSAKEIAHRTLEEACFSYYTTRYRRTKMYLLAWKIAVVSIIILVTYVLLDLVFEKLAITVK